MKRRPRMLAFEPLEVRKVLDATLHNAALPADVNQDGEISGVDALIIINRLNGVSSSESHFRPDVTNDGIVTPRDALFIINHLNLKAKKVGGTKATPPSEEPVAAIAGSDYKASFDAVEAVFDEGTDTFVMKPDNLLETDDVETLLKRASMATKSDDAIIAVVDRSGRILGVRVEDGVSDAIKLDPDKLAFAIDGAVAKARTAAYWMGAEVDV